MKKGSPTLLVMLAITLTGCASGPATFQTGPDAEVTFDDLTRLDGTVMDAAWARTDIDLSNYSKVMFEGAGIEYRPAKGPYSGRAGTTSMRRTNQTEFPLDDATKAKFREEIGSVFLEELGKSDQYEIVTEAGADVLLVRAGLLDVVSMVPPEPMGRGTIYLERVGEATLVLELRDSQSNAIFLRTVDRRAAERPGTAMESNPVTNRAEVRRLGRRWGGTLRNALESLIGQKQ